MDRGRTVAAHTDAQVTNPANGKAGSGKVAFRERYVRQRQLQVAGVFDLLRLKRFSVECANCNRNFLQALRLTLRGNNDYRPLELIIFRLPCILRPRRRSNGARADAGQQ